MTCAEWYHMHWFRNPSMVETEAWEAAQLAMRERAEQACKDVEVECQECAAHNDHYVCDIPLQDDYASAIRALQPE